MNTITLDILVATLWLVFWVLVSDAIGYITWDLSGQYPPDAFYVGALTNYWVYWFI